MDGSAAQYKNCKHFFNLCYNKNDFFIECVWTFLATSHGNSLCNGVGGPVKKLTAEASLQCPVADQILSAKDMMILGIKIVYAPSEAVTSVRSAL